jgi:transposase
MNPATRKAEQQQELDSLSRRNLKTARAYRMRLTFQELFAQPDGGAGEAFLKRWSYWATHSRWEPMIKAAKTIKGHWGGVLNWFESRLTTGFLEGPNSLVQAARGAGAGIPDEPEPDHDGRSGWWETSFQLTHMKQRGTLFNHYHLP